MSPKGKINVEHIRHNGARERLFFLAIKCFVCVSVCLCKSNHNSCWHNCIAAISVFQMHAQRRARVHTHTHAHEHARLHKASSPSGFVGSSHAGWQDSVCLPFPYRLLHATWSNKDKHMLGRLLEKYQGPRSRAASAPLCPERGGTL